MTDATPPDEAELRVWAEAHDPVGSVQAVQVLALLARVAELRRAAPKAVARVWTRQKPNGSGWYWWRNTDGKPRSRVVHVYRENGDWHVDAGTYFGPLAFWNGEWGGKVSDEP